MRSARRAMGAGLLLTLLGAGVWVVVSRSGSSGGAALVQRAGGASPATLLESGSRTRVPDWPQAESSAEDGPRERDPHAGPDPHENVDAVTPDVPVPPSSRVGEPSVARSAPADPSWRLSRLSAQDAEAGDEFGGAVAIDGDRLAVGAPAARVEGAACGEVHLYQRRGGSWSLQSVLAPPEPVAGLRFGASVAIGASRHLAVAAADHDGRGVVYVYEWLGSPELVRALRPDDRAPSECGPTSLDLAWGRLAVGWGTVTGEVASYLADEGWRREAVWRAGPLELSLGRRVAVGYEVVVASGLRSWGGGAQAFVSAWGVGSRLGEHERRFELAPGNEAGASCPLLPVSVTVSSSDYEVTLAPGPGLVHRFSHLDPRYDAELRSPAGEQDEYGAAPAQSGWLLVGAPSDDGAGEDAGCAHVYDHATGSWRLRATLRAEGARAGDRLGVAVDADERAAVRFQAALGAVPRAARPGYVMVAELPRP